MKKHIIFATLFSIISLFIVSFGISAYGYYKALHVDDPIDPYVLVHTGRTSIVRGDITINLDTSEEYRLLENDTIMTRDNSESIIFWPDRSTTHLGANSALTIHTMRVSADYTSIELEASLVQGKMYTNIVRTLFPGSKVSIRLPNQWLIAGVRGTEFSINLDAGYVHSFDHVVTLQNKLSQTVALMPGQAVDVKNIFLQYGADLVDHVWEDAVRLKDSAYQKAHSDAVSEAFAKISGNLATTNYWNQFVEWVLSHFAAFKEIEIIRYIENDATKLASVPTEKLIAVYQKFKVAELPNERDILRGVMFHIAEADKKMQQFLETLATESLWEKLKFPTLNLENTQNILDTFSKSSTIDIDGLIHNLSTKNYAEEISASAKNWLNALK